MAPKDQTKYPNPLHLFPLPLTSPPLRISRKHTLTVLFRFSSLYGNNDYTHGP